MFFSISLGWQGCSYWSIAFYSLKKFINCFQKVRLTRDVCCTALEKKINVHPVGFFLLFKSCTIHWFMLFLFVLCFLGWSFLQIWEIIEENLGEKMQLRNIYIKKGSFVCMHFQTCHTFHQQHLSIFWRNVTYVVSFSSLTYILLLLNMTIIIPWKFVMVYRIISVKLCAF